MQQQHKSTRAGHQGRKVDFNVSYISALTAELEQMAQSGGHVALAYYLDLARIEARRLATTGLSLQ
jgi:hypothetical protein